MRYSARTLSILPWSSTRPALGRHPRHPQDRMLGWLPLHGTRSTCLQAATFRCCGSANAKPAFEFFTTPRRTTSGAGAYNVVATGLRRPTTTAGNTKRRNRKPDLRSVLPPALQGGQDCLCTLDQFRRHIHGGHDAFQRRYEFWQRLFGMNERPILIAEAAVLHAPSSVGFGSSSEGILGQGHRATLTDRSEIGIHAIRMALGLSGRKSGL